MPACLRLWLRQTRVALVAAGALGLSSASMGPTALAEEPAARTKAAGERFFEERVRPLLAEHCYTCHGEKKQKGGLRLDSLEAILTGGESGPAIIAGKPGESLLVEAINYAGLEMPPKGKLPADKVDVLTRWVSIGAPWPSSDRAAHATAVAPPAPAPTAPASLWSFKPIRHVTVPEPARSDPRALSEWAQNPIDAFILQGLERHHLTPSPEADKATLIRRVTFDLTGLPPTLDEIDAFLLDDRPGAYERLVDRLLASPRYGERWGRHWLDLVRYAESDGYRQDAFRAQAWRYRDYVVRSLNVDKSYDRFLTEQLAGDEIDPDLPEMRVATGYLRLGTYEYNQRNVRGQWADILNDITDVTGEVFLGLSVGCARCHDHKFDPISQKDYYRLQAFFTPLMPRDDLTMATPAELARFRAARAAWEQAASDLLRQIDSLEHPYREQGTKSAFNKFPDEIKSILMKPESERSLLERQLGALAFRQIAYEHDQVPTLIKGSAKARWDELKKALKRFDAARPSAPAAVLTATDVGAEAPPTFVPGDRKGTPIEPGFLSTLEPGPAQIVPPKKAPQSTGRRLALARWLSRRDNPLSTRVIVNRVWQYHFGQGLAATPSDFGHLGQPPSHPELLDWLVSEFVASGWRLKPLHRLILTSAAYRQASVRAPAEIAACRRIDPENHLLWKQTVRRLDAEEIRDAMLACSGELSPTIGGPSVPTSQPRRTIDTRVIRNAVDPLVDAFDGADGTSSTSRRNITTTATQALLLINGEWTLARASTLAERIVRREPLSRRERSRVAYAYAFALGRPPEPEELEDALALLRRSASLLPTTGPSSEDPADNSGLVDLCHVLFNSNEFLYVD